MWVDGENSFNTRSCKIRIESFVSTKNTIGHPHIGLPIKKWGRRRYDEFL